MTLKPTIQNEYKIIMIIGRPYSLEIMESLYDKKKRFSDLKAICPNEVTLSRRLKELRENGLIRRNVKDIGKLIIYYVLTKKGRMIFELARKIVK